MLRYGGVGWGGGGAITFMFTCTLTSCYARLLFSCACTHIRDATLWWGGVGWGNNGSCSLAHWRHATLGCSSLALAHTYVMLRYGGVGWGGATTFMFTCTLTSCYARLLFSCACTHIRDATLWWGGVGWGNNVCSLAHWRHATLGCFYICYVSLFRLRICGFLIHSWRVYPLGENISWKHPALIADWLVFFFRFLHLCRAGSFCIWIMCVYIYIYSI